MTALTLSGIDKFCSENHVLDDVNLAVKSGNLVVIVGLTKGARIGLRPEHLRIVDRDRIQGHVLHYERLKTDTHVIVITEHIKLITVRVVGQGQFVLGTTIELDSDDQNPHLFDKIGQRVGPSSDDDTSIVYLADALTDRQDRPN